MTIWICKEFEGWAISLRSIFIKRNKATLFQNGVYIRYRKINQHEFIQKEWKFHFNTGYIIINAEKRKITALQGRVNNSKIVKKELSLNEYISFYIIPYFEYLVCLVF